MLTLYFLIIFFMVPSTNSEQSHRLDYKVSTITPIPSPTPVVKPKPTPVVGPTPTIFPGGGGTGGTVHNENPFKDIYKIKDINSLRAIVTNSTNQVLVNDATVDINQKSLENFRKAAEFFRVNVENERARSNINKEEYVELIEDYDNAIQSYKDAVKRVQKPNNEKSPPEQVPSPNKPKDKPLP